VSSLSVLAYVLGSVARRIGDALDLGGWILLPVLLTAFVIVELRRYRRRVRRIEDAAATDDGAATGRGTETRLH